MTKNVASQNNLALIVKMPFMDFAGKSVCNTVQIVWVSHIKLTGKPCIGLIFQQFQFVSS